MAVQRLDSKDCPKPSGEQLSGHGIHESIRGQHGIRQLLHLPVRVQHELRGHPLEAVIHLLQAEGVRHQPGIFCHRLHEHGAGDGLLLIHLLQQDLPLLHVVVEVQQQHRRHVLQPVLADHPGQRLRELLVGVHVHKGLAHKGHLRDRLLGIVLQALQAKDAEPQLCLGNRRHGTQKNAEDFWRVADSAQLGPTLRADPALDVTEAKSADEASNN